MPQDDINPATVFRRVSEALAALSADDLVKLTDSQYSVEIKAVRRRVKDDSESALTDTDVEEAIRRLSVLASRQEAQVLLDSMYESRKQLEIVARRLDIPIAKQDKVDALRDKIIEATVGARMRSQAIQGTGT